MKYKIEITETLQRVIEVEAENPNQALKKVEKYYSDGGIVLDGMDFVGHEIIYKGEAQK